MPPPRRPAKFRNLARPPRTLPPWLRPTILAFTFLLLTASFSSEISDTDTWWHLKTGQYIAQNHRLPVPDPFAYGTYLGRPAYPGEEHTRDFNLTHEWLAQVYFYLVYAAAGFPGIVLMRALLMILVCAAASLLAFRRTQNFYLSLAAAFLILGVHHDAPVMDRPLLLTLVLLMAVLLLLEFRTRVWLLPVIFLIWGNTHGGFIMGWAVLAAYCLGDLFLRWRRQPLPDGPSLWLPAAAAVLATGLNPNGFRALQILLLYQQSALQSKLIEWTPPALWPPEEMFTIVLYGAGILLLWARSKARPSDWLIYLMFGFAAARASRNVIFLGIAGAFLIASYFPWRRALPVLVEYAVAVLVLLGACLQIARGHAFELRAADWRFPSGAADFLQAHHIPGRIFNTYSDGGYLMWRLWPQQRVLLDGRALNETVAQDAAQIIEAANNSDQLLAKYGIDVIVAEGFEYYTGRIWSLPANLAMSGQTEWKLVQRDSSSVVFMRHPPPDVQVFDPRDALASFEQQCEVHLAHDPAWPGCAAGLARLFAGNRDLTRARKWGAIFLDHQAHPDPNDVRAFQQLLMQ